MPVAPEHAGGGPFYFAWVDPGETAFGDEHIRYDEYVFSFSLPQIEGDFATLSIDIANPKTGLFSPDRKVWAWFARDSFESDGIEPLFFGRIVGLPGDVLAEVITVQFTSRPEDYADQKMDLADSLKVLPYYDEVWVDQQQKDNPDVALEGYSVAWHIDRVTHEVTVSDILVGEDGTLTFGDGDAFYENLSVSLDSFPRSSVSFDGSVTWTQQETGTVGIGSRTFDSYTASSIASGWPKPGQSIGQGWSVAGSSAQTSGLIDAPMVNWSVSWQNQAQKHVDGDTMSIQESFSGPKGSLANSGITLTSGGYVVVGDPFTGTPASAEVHRTAAIIGISGSVTTSLSLRYDAKLKREEHVKFTLTADLQPVLHSEDTSETNDPVIISGNDVGLPISDNSSDGVEVPIGTLSRNAYFPTARGLLSLEHLLLRARAQLLLGARVGRVSWECRFEEATQLSCRKNAILHDPRVSGGNVAGKIISYELTGDGDSGVFLGKVTIACAVGKGTAVAADPGTADYIEDGYIEVGYYARNGQVDLVGAGDVGYSPPVYTTSGLVFPLTRSQVVVREEVINTIIDQQDAIDNATPPAITYINPLSIDAFKARAEARIQSIVTELQKESQKYELEVKPVTGNADPVEYDIDTTILSIPKQIDLASTGL